MTGPSDVPTVSMVIPSLEGNSEDLNRLKQAGINSGIPEDALEIIVAVGVSPNGRARDAGAIRARGDYLLFLDADVSVPNPSDLRTIIECLEREDEVGLAGPAQQLPDELSETERQRALQIPRTHVSVVDEFTESDMVTHACLAIKTSLFRDLGAEHPNLISGTDPDLRHRVRKHGLRVGIVPNTRVTHPPILSLSTLVTKRFRMGRWSRWVKRHYPEYHLATEPGLTSTSEAERTGLGDRLLRNIRRLLNHLAGGEFHGLSARLAYGLGNLCETAVDGDWVNRLPYVEPPDRDPKKWDTFVRCLAGEGDVRYLKRAPWSLGDEQPFDPRWLLNKDEP